LFGFIYKSKIEMYARLGYCIYERGLVETVRLADKAFDSIAVHGVLEEVLAYRHKQLARRTVIFVINTVMHPERIHPKRTSAREKPVYLDDTL
jgi:hypothetical protein